MGFGSGLATQLMLAEESTVGTAVTVTTGYEIDSEDLMYDPTWLEGQGLAAGQAYTLDSRVAISRHGVKNGFQVQHMDAGHFAKLWKQCLGTLVGPTQIASTTAYKSIITPGVKDALSMTVQVGRAQAFDGVVKPFTYRGCKVTDWEFSCSDNSRPTLKLTLDGWQEDTATALVAASYTSPRAVFSFADASAFTLGGTVSTSGGETTISGGTPVATVVKGITIKGTTPVAVDRYGLGNSGLKKAQLQNGHPSISVSLDSEFYNRTELYDLFKAGTSTPMYLAFSHGDAGSSNPYLLSFTIPALRLKNAAVNAGGPDILPQKADAQAYDNGTDPVIQVKLVSKDTTA